MSTLPTITCSTCHLPIPLDSLGDHICSAPPRPAPSWAPQQYSQQPQPQRPQQPQQQQRRRSRSNTTTTRPPPLSTAPPSGAGMAGVGRRAFTPSPSTSYFPPQPAFGAPQRPVSPALAARGGGAAGVGGMGYNQSQPYFIASEGRLREEEERRAREREERDRAAWERERVARERAERERGMREAERARMLSEEREKAKEAKMKEQEVLRRDREEAREMGRREDVDRERMERGREEDERRRRMAGKEGGGSRSAVEETRARPWEQQPMRQNTYPTPRKPSSELTRGLSLETSRTASSDASRPSQPVVQQSQSDPAVQTLAAGSRLPFFERYKQLVGGAAGGLGAGVGKAVGAAAGAVAERTGMGKKDEVAEGGEIKFGVGKTDPNSSGDDSHYDTPSEVEDNGDEDEDSGLPWARTRKEVSPVRVGKSDQGGSISSMEAEKLRLGEMEPLTPSGSMDRLDLGGREELEDRTPKSRSDRASWRKHKKSGSGRSVPRDELVYSGSESDNGRLAFSPSMSASRHLSPRNDRDSFGSDMIAPSDSVSLIAGPPGSGGRTRENTLTPGNARRLAGAGAGGKSCQKCGESLRGKKFIERDGIMLCERDWKEMFLPKCRRCSKPIETSAVSSSDGQLKGKWHRACFCCAKCDEPFEGNTFYVHNDKPYCQLHYHELNNTICASSLCGAPIEGPCLLTSAGQRYHPGHLKCDHRPSPSRPGALCRDPMTDYYEVGKLRVCEKHKDEALRVVGRMLERAGSGGGKVGMAKAEKRRTRLVRA